MVVAELVDHIDQAQRALGCSDDVAGEQQRFDQADILEGGDLLVALRSEHSDAGLDTGYLRAVAEPRTDHRSQAQAGCKGGSLGIACSGEHPGCVDRQCVGRLHVAEFDQNRGLVESACRQIDDVSAAAKGSSRACVAV